MNNRHMYKNLYMILLVIICFLLLFIFAKIFINPKKENEEKVIQAVHVTKIDSINVEKEIPLLPNETLNEKKVYLTFDDGPSELTEHFLDVLLANDVKATFFMQGVHLEKEKLKSSVKRAVKEGHYVGGHSMTHAFDLLYTEEQFVAEMNENLELIYEITGIHPNLVRPPYGSTPGLINENIQEELAVSGMKVWDWTIDSEDWDLENNPSQIVDNIKTNTKLDVEVILMHEKPQTLAVLPEIITFFKESGYDFAVYNEEEHFQLNFLNDVRF